MSFNEIPQFRQRTTPCICIFLGLTNVNERTCVGVFLGFLFIRQPQSSIHQTKYNKVSGRLRNTVQTQSAARDFPLFNEHLRTRLKINLGGMPHLAAGLEEELQAKMSELQYWYHSFSITGFFVKKLSIGMPHTIEKL